MKLIESSGYTFIDFCSKYDSTNHTIYFQFKIPAKGYDPYDVTTGLDTIYTKEGVIANYSGHLPAKHIL